jgi:glycosyltransferase 2 family protein
MWKRISAVVVSIGVSAVFLWLALRGIDLDAVWADIRRANFGWIALSLLIGMVSIYTRAIRWQGLVDFKVNQRQAFYIVGVMFMLNLFFRLGEVARTVLARRENIPVITTATSIVVERLLDTVLVLLVLLIVVTQVPDMPPEVAANVARVAPVFAALSVIAFVTLIVLARYPRFAHRLLHIFINRIPPLKRLPLDELLDHLLHGLKPLVEWRSAAHALGWTAVSWLLSWIVFAMVQLAFADTTDVVLQASMGMSLASFSVALPSVGAIGPFEAAMILAGQAFGEPESTALAIGVVVHVVTIIAYVVSGLWGSIGLGVALTDVMQRADAAGTNTDGAAVPAESGN